MLLQFAALVLLVPPLVLTQGPPSPPPDAITCPYPAASSIKPCECLADPTTFRVFLFCYWDMGQDNEADVAKFSSVLAQFDTYTQIYVMQMSCEHCFNFELDAYFNEETTGKFEISYFTLEHFDATSLAGNEEQFTESALVGSQTSLTYAKIYPYHYFTPSLRLLAGMTELEELYLQRLDTSLAGLPDLSSLTNLKFLSLLDGNLGSVSATNFAGLDVLSSLYLDRCHITTLEPGSFSNLSSLNHLSMEFNNFTHVPAKTFVNLPALVRLNMGGGSIETVGDNFEDANPNIQILLHDNHITTLPEETWRSLVEKMLNTPLSQGVIDVANNPLDCGCDVKWLIVDLKAPQVFRNARCANGENLVDLDPDVLEFFCPTSP